MYNMLISERIWNSLFLRRLFCGHCSITVLTLLGTTPPPFSADHKPIFARIMHLFDFTLSHSTV